MGRPGTLDELGLADMAVGGRIGRGHRALIGQRQRQLSGKFLLFLQPRRIIGEGSAIDQPPAIVTPPARPDQGGFIEHHRRLR